MITNLKFILLEVNTDASLKWSTERFGPWFNYFIFLIHLNDNTDTVSTANVFLFLVTKVATQGKDIEWLEIKMLKKVDAMSQYFVKINLVVNAETTGCVCF